MLSFIKENHIFLNQNILSKKQLFKFVADHAYKLQISTNQVSVIKSLNEREAHSSTLISENIALPHARSPDINILSVFIITLENAIEYDDKEYASLFFCILAPLTANDDFIEILMNIAKMTTNDDFISMLHKDPTPTEILINIEKIILGGS